MSFTLAVNTFAIDDIPQETAMESTERPVHSGKSAKRGRRLAAAGIMSINTAAVDSSDTTTSEPAGFAGGTSAKRHGRLAAESPLLRHKRLLWCS